MGLVNITLSSSRSHLARIQGIDGETILDR